MLFGLSNKSREVHVLTGQLKYTYKKIQTFTSKIIWKGMYQHDGRLKTVEHLLTTV